MAQTMVRPLRCMRFNGLVHRHIVTAAPKMVFAYQVFVVSRFYGECKQACLANCASAWHVAGGLPCDSNNAAAAVQRSPQRRWGRSPAQRAAPVCAPTSGPTAAVWWAPTSSPPLGRCAELFAIVTHTPIHGTLPMCKPCH